MFQVFRGTRLSRPPPDANCTFHGISAWDKEYIVNDRVDDDRRQGALPDVSYLGFTLRLVLAFGLAHLLFLRLLCLLGLFILILFLFGWVFLCRRSRLLGFFFGGGTLLFFLLHFGLFLGLGLLLRPFLI